jgi:hypothetical protein
MLDAKTLGELGRVLFATAPVRQIPFVAGMVFRAFQRARPEEAADAALLLCTDPRWSGRTAHLVRDLLASDLIPKAGLDLLAETILAAETRFAIDIPVEWIEPEASSRRGDPGSRHPAVRQVEPPLRRWAAAHRVRGDAARLDEVVALARTLRGPSAAAIAAGLVDAVPSLPANAAEQVLKLALEWPAGGVRLAALAVIAERQGEQAALALTKSDPDARVRRWRPAQTRSRAHEQAQETRKAASGGRAADQMALFADADDRAAE